MTSFKQYNDMIEEFDANTLLQQLGGRKFMAMTGAKDLVVSREEKWLGFKIGRNSKGITTSKYIISQMIHILWSLVDLENLIIK